ncbi:MAG: ParA family protein [Deltaproteobacteria bacterium]|nr:MAG: ParA family protein [Deltaproteobacteria bacterium]
MRTIAIINQKGGCGKTTTAVNLAGRLAADGSRVLVIDLDPQAHATLALGIDPDLVEDNLYDVLADDDGAALDRVILDVGKAIDLAPSGIALSALEQKLAGDHVEARTERLSHALAALPPVYDYALIDCPPNVGLLSFNALRAADEVIVPLEMSIFAVHGVQKVLETIGLLSDRIGYDVEIRLLPTLYDARTRNAREMLMEIRDLFKDLCFSTVIRSSVKVRDAARRGVPVVRFAPSSNAAHDYGSLAFEIQALTARHDSERPAAQRVGFAPTASWPTTAEPVTATEVRSAPGPNGSGGRSGSVVPAR